MSKRIFIAAAVALFVGQTVGSAAHAQAPAPSSEEEIVVTGERLRQMVWDFIGDVSVASSREDQLARWDQRICAGVVGLTRRQGAFIADRIGQRAHAVGLPVGEPGCRANVLVLVTSEAEELARALAERERYLMANYGRQDHLETRGAEALEDFVSTPRPVRWWHVAQTETVDGRVLRNTQPWGRMTGPRSAEIRSVEVVRTTVSDFGRMNRPTHQAFRNVVIIVDAQRAGDRRLDQLADYLAMAALAQIDPSADVSAYPSILNLFAEAPGAAELTAWDLAYLEGLYKARQNATSSRAQQRQIRQEMIEELSDRE